MYNGVNNGLVLLLDAEVFDYTSTFSDSEGFVLSILHQLDIPILKQTGVNVQPGQSVQVIIRHLTSCSITRVLFPILDCCDANHHRHYYCLQATFLPQEEAVLF